jgi:pyrroline-5-carboxylate reductase
VRRGQECPRRTLFSWLTWERTQANCCWTKTASIALPMSSTVFLGGGRITSALVAGLRLANYKKRIVVHDRHLRKLQLLKRAYGVQVETDLARAVDCAGMLIIAVRPKSIPELLEQIGEIRRPITAVSLAAGVLLAKLRSKLGPPVRWARAMPSPVSRFGRGLTALTFPPRSSTSAKREVTRLFAHVGSVVDIPESKFDVFTVTYSTTHGYHALATLVREAEKVGLDRQSALTASAHALADGILLWRDGKIPLDKLLQEAATPGGIAATVMSAMNAAGYQRAIARGLRAGVARARKNAGR